MVAQQFSWILRISPEGNRELARYTQEWFQSNMKNWEATINHYLRTGKMSA